MGLNLITRCSIEWREGSGWNHGEHNKDPLVRDQGHEEKEGRVIFRCTRNFRAIRKPHRKVERGYKERDFNVVK